MTAARPWLVTGATGFVAGSILAQAGEGAELHALSRAPARPDSGSRPPHWHVCASTDRAALAEVFRRVQPAAVIHTAALADIDFCQANPAAAQAANVDFTRALAELCADFHARLIFCSTDTVFDGEHAPYTETDPPGPVNVYAETKVAAEQIVARLGASAVIARLALVMGLPVRGAGNSFLAKWLESFRTGRAVSVPAHEVRTPLDVLTAGRALLELAGSDFSGVIHLAGNESLNRLDLARRLARRFGFPESLVVTQAPAAAPGRAPRPRDVSLANAKARAMLRTPMRSLDEALDLIQATAVVEKS
jgi:dTDP-4-dehydrorhamnose reductase